MRAPPPRGRGVARVSSGRGVMELVKEVAAKGRVGGDADAGVEVPEVVGLELDERGTLGIRGVVGVSSIRSLDVVESMRMRWVGSRSASWWSRVRATGVRSCRCERCGRRERASAWFSGPLR